LHARKLQHIQAQTKWDLQTADYKAKLEYELMMIHAKELLQGPMPAKPSSNLNRILHEKANTADNAHKAMARRNLRERGVYAPPSRPRFTLLLAEPMRLSLNARVKAKLRALEMEREMAMMPQGAANRLRRLDSKTPTKPDDPTRSESPLIQSRGPHTD